MKKSFVLLVTAVLVVSVFPLFVSAGFMPVDSDGDGVYDIMDLCPGTPIGTAVDSDGCPVVVDSDNDGVLDSEDSCSDTLAGEIVNAEGCSISQLCALEGYKNHGKYVSCVAKQTKIFAEMLLIENNERGQIVSEAAQSEIGK